MPLVVAPALRCEECGGAARRYRRGRCPRCYGALLATGARVRQPLTAEARYFALVDRAGPTPAHAPFLGPCWLWTGAVHSNGYGQYKAAPTRPVLAHRWVVERVIGRRLTRAEQVDHLCHDPAVCPGGPTCPHRRCVNLAHLAITSAAANNARSGSLTAAKARAQTCVRGHPLVGDNVYRHPQRGTRHCRACAAGRARAWAAQRSQAARAGRKRAARAAVATVVLLDDVRAARAPAPAPAPAGARAPSPTSGSEADR